MSPPSPVTNHLVKSPKRSRGGDGGSGEGMGSFVIWVVAGVVENWKPSPFDAGWDKDEVPIDGNEN